jgi:replicative DNA helicase
MTTQIEFENYVPHSIDEFLSRLYTIKDCVSRKRYQEACLHISDVLAKVQNEIDWCHRTDPVLAYMHDFLRVLFTLVNTLRNVALSHVSDPLKETVKLIEETQQEIANRAAGIPRWPAPGDSIDYLEKEHRMRTYGLKK